MLKPQVPSRFYFKIHLLPIDDVTVIMMISMVANDLMQKRKKVERNMDYIRAKT